MKLDRALIKSQAKGIIKGQVLSLFFISIVVSILVGGIGASFSFENSNLDNIKNKIENKIDGDVDDRDYFDDFLDDGKPNLDYFKDFTGSMSVIPTASITSVVRDASYRLSSLASIILAPLGITLCGLYVMIIRGNKFKTGDMFKYVFTKTFDKNYFDKFLLSLVKSILTVVLLCLFIVPGVIFYYRYYFAETIMADNPGIGVREAMKRSKQMTDGHKGELFALDLSFIGWALLFPLTLGIISIYFIPYASTVKALYYENFRIRYMHESAMNYANYMNMQNDSYYQPQPEIKQEPSINYGSGMDTDYYNGNF